ncbi:ketopantoate reductase [Zhouia amylolytica]|uniref:2-dehydropantoate 2-reductase n=2 Tax=Zhouia amylolytica TaxID=376730 RepID=W2UMK7_9FLAO|nr:2-dehydropantoate 2-reductase [Zhouia amylolytica]ETN94582.1 ketopantoate reductase PanE/ApbA [Zhouia amylolytica AD3]MCQ0111584.1 2-dehydropantoate 2-reductase [Zhouia amylolytica]SFS77580.1 ketopantoate reductase [Zhouia amylolytica]
MRIVVYGIGGVGGYFGGKLAKTSHKVSFIARGRHLEAIQRNGLQVKSIYGDFVAAPNTVTSDVHSLHAADLIIVCTKSWQVNDVARDIKPLVSEHTMVLPLQNGADNVDKLINVLGKDNVIGGLCRIISFVESPGVIHHKAFHPQVMFGELNNEKSERIQLLKKVFDEAGFDNLIADDIQAAIWKKFLFICTISGIGALTRAEMGVMRENSFVMEVMRKTADEILKLAQAKGVHLTQKDVEAVFEGIANQDPHTTASMQRDIMEGKPSELEDFNGYVVREAKKYGIEVPVNEFIYHLLLPQEKRARAKFK